MPASASQPRDILVFDMDGVLVDVRRSYPRAVIRTVAALGGGKVTLSDIRVLKAAGGYNNDWDLSRELLRRRLPASRISRQRVAATFNRFYLGDDWNGLILNETWQLPPALLARLARRWRLAIFTGRPRAFAAFTLRRFGVEGWFRELVTLEDVRRGKPAPDGLRLLQRRHAPAAIAAYFGDLVDDARCAARAGVPFVGVGHHAALLAREGARFTAPGVAAAVKTWLIASSASRAASAAG